MIWTHPRNLGTPFCGLKITKTEGAKIISGLKKSSQHTFQKTKSGREKNLKKQKH